MGQTKIIVIALEVHESVDEDKIYEGLCSGLHEGNWDILEEIGADVFDISVFESIVTRNKT